MTENKAPSNAAEVSDTEDIRMQSDKDQLNTPGDQNKPAGSASGEAELVSMDSLGDGAAVGASATKSVVKREIPDTNKLHFSINTTWNGDPIEHDPITMSIEGRGDHVLWRIDAPYMGDPAPPSQPGEPLWQLWEYEVVEAFFLNDDDQYLEVELGPHGQHIVLLLYGKRNILRHSLPMEVTATISGNRWQGTGVIPIEYFPPKVNRFNAYAMHVPGKRRHQESLYPADPAKQAEAEFHALEYFQPLDLQSLIEGYWDLPQSQLWNDSMAGIYRYEIETTWNGMAVEHKPVTITLKELSKSGVLVNVTAPFFNDTKPLENPENPLDNICNYEVVEIFFTNDKDEYLKVAVGPWGHYQVWLFSGVRKVARKSLCLTFTVLSRTEGTQQEPGEWRGNALVPASYFPPRVTRMNAFAKHGEGDHRAHEALYPAPSNHPNYSQPDNHKLELFEKIDIENLLANNNQQTTYSTVWKCALEDVKTAKPSASRACRQSLPPLLLTAALGVAIAGAIRYWRSFK